MINFKKNVLRIYTTKVLGIGTGLLSVFLVVPRLTSDPTTYGIYTLCIGLGMFFSYADLGFLSAGQKYAAEAYVQKNRKEEMRVISFVLFILGVFLTLVMLGLIYMAFNPSVLIKNGSDSSFTISSHLILILALSSPVIILQKFNILVCSIRIEEYIYQIIDIIFNLIKILSIQLFVTDTSYNITGYYLTTQLLNLTAALVGLVIIKYKYQYELFSIIKYFKFSKEMYNLTKGLALSSLALTMAWILYFELDTLILSKFYGIEVLAIYGVAFVFLNFCRTFYNTLLGPYLSYFYHFTGTNDQQGLIGAFSSMMKWTFPLMFIPPVVLILYMPQIIDVWVGVSYRSAVLISRIFVITIALTAINIPIGYLIIAKAFNKVLRLNSILLPLIFYASLILFDYSGLSGLSLAVAKFVTIFVNLVINLVIIIRLLGKDVLYLYIDLAKKTVLPLVMIAILFYFIPFNQKMEKGSLISFLNLGVRAGVVFLLPMLTYYLMEEKSRNQIKQLLKRKVVAV